MVRLVVWLLILAVLAVIAVATYTSGNQHTAMGWMALLVGAFVLGAFAVAGYSAPGGHTPR